MNPFCPDCGTELRHDDRDNLYCPKCDPETYDRELKDHADDQRLHEYLDNGRKR